MRVSVLYHESAGSGVSRNDLAQQIEGAGHELLHMVEKDIDFERVLDDSTELVVAAGGDGTVWRAANALAGRGIPMAILPLGTANNIATSLEIEGSIAQLIGSWSLARRRPLDVGVARGRWGESRFLEGVGGGLIPQGIAAMHEASEPHEEDVHSRLARAIRTYYEALSHLKPHHWTLTLDGTRMEGDFLLVEALNTRAVGPNLVLSPNADPSDGLLSVVTAEEEHRQEVAGYLRYRMEGKECRLSLPAHAARQLVIQGWKAMHVDDEVRRSASIGTVSIRIEHQALELFV